jgi:hypothetical protein
VQPATLTHGVQVKYAGLVVFEETSTFVPGARYSVLCSGDFAVMGTAGLRCLLMNDVPDPAPDQGFTMLRVIHVVRSKADFALTSASIQSTFRSPDLATFADYGALGAFAVGDIDTLESEVAPPIDFVPTTLSVNFQDGFAASAVLAPTFGVTGLTFVLTDGVAASAVSIVALDSLGHMTILR